MREIEMNGYCGDCDKQIEFHKGTVIQKKNEEGVVLIFLKCPWCEELELITKLELNN
jgi:hypothetical protein